MYLDKELALLAALFSGTSIASQCVSLSYKMHNPRSPSPPTVRPASSPRLWRREDHSFSAAAKAANLNAVCRGRRPCRRGRIASQ